MFGPTFGEETNFHQIHCVCCEGCNLKPLCDLQAKLVDGIFRADFIIASPRYQAGAGLFIQ